MVDWSLAVAPNPLKNIQQGQDYVNGLFDQQARMKAGNAFASGDYGSAVSALAGRGDIQDATAVKDYSQKQDAITAQKAAGQQFGTGDYTGAAKTLAGSGDLKGATAVGDYGQSEADKKAIQFTKQHDYLQRAVPVLQGIAQKAGPQAVAQAFEQIVPDLQAMGTAPEQIAQLRQAMATNPEQTLQILSATAQKKFTFQKVGEDVVVFDEQNPGAGPVATFKGTPADDWETKNIIQGGNEISVQVNKKTGETRPVQGSTAGPRFNQPPPKSGNDDAGWQLANDPMTNTQYRINVRTGQTVGLDGNPYKPKGAGKISGGTPRSAMAMAVQKFTQENPDATADDIARFAGTYNRTIQQIGGETKADSAALTQLTKLGTAASAQEHSMAGAISQVMALMNKGAGTTAGPLINRWYQAGRKATGDPDVAAFNTAVETAAQEYAKIITGSTGATDASRAEAASMMDKFQSPQALLAQLAVIQKDAHFKIQSYTDHTDFIKNKMSSGQSGASIPAQPSNAGPSPANVIRYDQNGNRVQ